MSGLVWLFAGVHVRDAMVFFLVTALSFAWLSFLNKPDVHWRLPIVVGSSLSFSYILFYLRNEYVMVPAAMAVAGIVSLIVSQKSSRQRLAAYAALLGGLVGLIIFGGTVSSQALSQTSSGREAYTALSQEQHNHESLGYSIIIDQPLPIRLVLGTIYLYMFPIPFWNGFLSSSAYLAFKSCNVLLFYVLVPLIVTGLGQYWSRPSVRTPEAMFVLFTAAGFSATVAVTSLESRHFGAFLAPVFLLALMADIRQPIVYRQFYNYCQIMLAGVVGIHLLWAFLKLR